MAGGSVAAAGGMDSHDGGEFGGYFLLIVWHLHLTTNIELISGEKLNSEDVIKKVC